MWINVRNSIVVHWILDGICDTSRCVNGNSLAAFSKRRTLTQLEQTVIVVSGWCAISHWKNGIGLNSNSPVKLNIRIVTVEPNGNSLGNGWKSNFFHYLTLFWGFKTIRWNKQTNKFMLKKTHQSHWDNGIRVCSWTCKKRLALFYQD